MQFKLTNKVVISLVSFVFAMVLTSNVNAAAWSQNQIDFVYGDDYELFSDGDSSDVTSFTFEHLSGWALGTNFFFADVTKDDNDLDIYSEFAATLSLSKVGSKITGEKVNFGFGPVNDVSALLGYNFGGVDASDTGVAGATNTFATEQFSVNDTIKLLYGVEFSLAVPGFDFVGLQVGVLDDLNSDSNLDSTWILTPFWTTSFFIGNSRWKFEGYADFIEKADNSGFHEAWVFSQSQLMLDVGYYMQEPDKLYIGTEIQWTQNKFGIDQADEFFPTFIIEWIL